MKDIHAVKGRYYLQRAIAEGEHVHQDFKFAISDACKIARSLSAFANNDGGHLLIGVKDNGIIAGVRNEEDIYVVEQAAQLYCRPRQTLEFTAFKATEGTVVIRASIPASTHRPVMARDADGSWHAYYRVADENIAASPLMVRAWRRKADASPTMLSLSQAEHTLLNHLRTVGPISVEKFTKIGRLSQQSAEDIIVRLYALDVVCFKFVHRQFLIAPAPAEP